MGTQPTSKPFGVVKPWDTAVLANLQGGASFTAGLLRVNESKAHARVRQDINHTEVPRPLSSGWGQGIYRGRIQGSLIPDDKNDLSAFDRHHLDDPVDFP